MDIRSVTLVDNTALALTLSVTDALTQFLLLNIKAVNCDDVARVITVTKYAEAAKTNNVKTLFTISRNAGATFNWPNSTMAEVGTIPLGLKPELLVSPAVIVVNFAAGGASTGAIDADGLVFEYLRMNRTQ